MGVEEKRKAQPLPKKKKKKRKKQIKEHTLWIRDIVDENYKNNQTE